jgi:hypothetical protein
MAAAMGRRWEGGAVNLMGTLRLNPIGVFILLMKYKAQKLLGT